MKFNLKNRPRFYPPKSISGYTKEERGILDTFERWFDGFEKELRERYRADCQLRIGDIAADARAFLIESIFALEPEDILAVDSSGDEQR